MIIVSFFVGLVIGVAVALAGVVIGLKEDEK